MARIIKNGLIGLAAVLALILLLVLILFLTFNPNDYKPRIIELVQQKKHRTLSIPGEIKLSLFPGIGADLGQVSLSERDSQKQFAEVRHVRLSLALLPLLKKQFLVDKVMVEGVRLELVRDKLGKMNIDDLLSKEPEEKDASVKFDVGSVQVVDGQFLFDDQQQQRRMDIAKFNLQVGGASADRWQATIFGAEPDCGPVQPAQSAWRRDAAYIGWQCKMGWQSPRQPVQGPTRSESL
jgi:AsmA protein